MTFACEASRLDLEMPFSQEAIRKGLRKPLVALGHTQGFPSVGQQTTVNEHKVNPKETR